MGLTLQRRSVFPETSMCLSTSSVCPAPHCTGPNAITVEAEIIESMGAETLVHARTQSQTEIRVVVARETRVSPGDILHLKPDPGQTHVFDSAGKAVRT